MLLHIILVIVAKLDSCWYRFKIWLHCENEWFLIHNFPQLEQRNLNHKTSSTKNTHKNNQRYGTKINVSPDRLWNFLPLFLYMNYHTHLQMYQHHWILLLCEWQNILAQQENVENRWVSMKQGTTHLFWLCLGQLTLKYFLKYLGW